MVKSIDADLLQHTFAVQIDEIAWRVWRCDGLILTRRVS